MPVFDPAPYSPLDPPAGEERWDGLDGRLGTPTPNEGLVVSGVDGAVQSQEETPESPRIERAEQKTVHHSLQMSWAQARLHQARLYRGLVFAESAEPDADQYKILSVTIRHGTGDTATLDIASECVTSDVPPDEFSVTPLELGINIIKHPRYFYAFKGANDDEEALNQMVIRELQNYMSNPQINLRNAIAWRLTHSQGSPGTITTDPLTGNRIPVPAADVTANGVTFTPITGTDFAKIMACEVIRKFWLNIETPYIVGWRVAYSKYYRRSPYLHPGGIIQPPWDAGPDTVLDYFLRSPDVDEIVSAPQDTIFANMVLQNPQCYYPPGWRYQQEGIDLVTNISWLRHADTSHFVRTFFRKDMVWVGTPVGIWDQDLFSPSAPPYTDGVDVYNAAVNANSDTPWLPPLPKRPPVMPP